MKSELILTSTLAMTEDEWFDFRQGGIGASEVSTVIGLNPYKASIQLFYEKLGQSPISREENAAMFWGTELEAVVADKWQYWDPADPSDLTMIKNYRAGNLIRKCARVNAFIQNPIYPWLFVSLDRKMAKQPGKGEGALEIKTISGFAADQWESGIPPMYLMQLQCQLMVCGFDHGELAILKDGRNMDVLPFEAHPSIQVEIAERTRLFWQRVAEAKQLVELKAEEVRQGNTAMAEILQSQIDNLAPEPDGSMAFESYLKKRYENPNGGTIHGEDVHFDIAKQYKSTGEHIEALETAKRECANKLKAVMGDYDCLDFGALGRVTWRANKNGIRSFKVSLTA